MRIIWSAVVVMLCVIGFCTPATGTANPTGAVEFARAKVKAPVLGTPVERPRKVVFVGRAMPRTVVRLQRRGATRWVNVGKARATRTGRFRIAVRPAVTVRSYRVAAGGRTSAPRRLVPAALAPVKSPTTIPTPTSTPTSPTTPDPTVDPAEKPAPGPSDACGEQPKKADGSYYECSFDEEFDGNTLDTSKWLTQETWFSGMTTAHQDCFVNNDDTIAVGDGVLRLTAIRGLEEFDCKSPLGTFKTASTAGAVTTYGRFNQAYGRFSFRAKMPDGAGIPGFGSALWLYPQKHTYGAWPYSGEIDVAEWYSGAPDNAYPSVHYAGEPSPKTTGADCAVSTASTQFHTYSVDWSPTQMQFSYDGKVCFTWDWRSTSVLTGGQPFDQPFYFVLSQVWGVLWNAPTAATPLRTTLTVDWVRAWK